jgi:hypothetical protein
MYSLTLLSNALVELFIEIGCNNIKEGSNMAFESMKIHFNLTCLHKFTPNGSECQVGKKFSYFF